MSSITRYEMGMGVVSYVCSSEPELIHVLFEISVGFTLLGHGVEEKLFYYRLEIMYVT